MITVHALTGFSLLLILKMYEDLIGGGGGEGVSHMKVSDENSSHSQGFYPRKWEGLACPSHFLREKPWGQGWRMLVILLSRGSGLFLGDHDGKPVFVPKKYKCCSSIIMNILSQLPVKYKD